MTDHRTRLAEMLRAVGYPHRLRKSGSLDVLCPWHLEKTPSVRVFADRWVYCHGCQRNGTVEELVEAIGFDPKLLENPSQRTLEEMGQLLLPFAYLPPTTSAWLPVIHAVQTRRQRQFHLCPEPAEDDDL